MAPQDDLRQAELTFNDQLSADRETAIKALDAASDMNEVIWGMRGMSAAAKTWVLMIVLSNPDPELVDEVLDRLRAQFQNRSEGGAIESANPKTPRQSTTNQG